MNRLHTDTVALRHAFNLAGLTTVKACAEFSGVNRNTLGRIFEGKEQPSAMVMDKIVSILQLSPEKAGNIFFAGNLPNK